MTACFIHHNVTIEPPAARCPSSSQNISKLINYFQNSRFESECHSPIIQPGVKFYMKSDSIEQAAGILYIPKDRRDEFQQIVEGLEKAFCPEGDAQMIFFDRIVSTTWRLWRCDRCEVLLGERAAQSGIDPMLDLALEPLMANIDRSRAQATEELHKAIGLLRDVQADAQFRALTERSLSPKRFRDFGEESPATSKKGGKVRVN